MSYCEFTANKLQRTNFKIKCYKNLKFLEPRGKEFTYFTLAQKIDISNVKA